MMQTNASSPPALPARPGRLRFSRPVLAVGLVMAGLLLAMVAQHGLAIRASQTITLPAEGYDPRDLLAGHYAQLRTHLHRIPHDRVQGDVRQGDRLWVTIAPEGEGWRIVNASARRPQPGPGEMVLKAEVLWSADRASQSEVHVAYGIERWFAAQDKALEIEQIARDTDEDTDITMIVAIDPSGQARLTGLAIGDTRETLTWW